MFVRDGVPRGQLDSGGSRICQRGRRTMASARSVSLNGGLGRSPQRGPGAEPLVGGQGAKPPEGESFCIILHKKVAKS